MGRFSFIMSDKVCQLILATVPNHYLNKLTGTTFLGLPFLTAHSPSEWTGIYNSPKRPNSTLERNLIRLCFQPLNIEGFLLHHGRLCLSVDTCSSFKLFLTNLQFLNKLTGTKFLGTSNDLDR